MYKVLEAFREQFAKIAESGKSQAEIAESIRAVPIPEEYKNSLFMRPMGKDEFKTNSWYIDINDVLYCDIELSVDGKYSVYFRDRVTEAVGWADQAEVTQSK